MKQLLLLALVFVGCSASAKFTSVPKHLLQPLPIQLSDDFFVTVAEAGQVVPADAFLLQNSLKNPLQNPLKNPWQKLSGDPIACQDQLKRAVCETFASTFEITHSYASVQCSPDSAKYVPFLMQIFDEMPEKMRISLCSLDRVFVSDNITSVAFASSVTNELGQVTGGYIGMRKGTFVSQPSASQILSWKEQLAYGGSKTFLANDSALVQLHYGFKMSTLKADGIFYVLMHEMGHLIDFNNHINSASGFATAWTKLSWQNDSLPLADSTFYRRDDICFYECRKPPLDPSEASKIYSSMKESAFITSYSSQNSWEDFAENWAWRILENEKSPDYQIEIPGSGIIDMNDVFRTNAKVQAKMRFIDQLWNDPKLVIDNRVH